MLCPHCQREIAANSNFCYYCGSRQPAAPRSFAAAKRLMRSCADCKIAGVCAGFAEYVDVDVTVVRLIWVLVTFFSGILPGILAYIVAWIIMPKAPQPLRAPAGNATPQSAQSS